MDRRNGLIALKEAAKEKAGGMRGADRRVKIIVCIGIIGIALIVLSELFFSGGEKQPGDPGAGNGSISSESYTETLERRLEALIETIEGVGETKVMITLRSGAETVYEKNGKSDDDRTSDVGESSSRVSMSSREEQSVAILDGSGGREALVQKQIEPEIGGVAVVCAGGGDVLVQKRVIDAVTTVLGITSARVYVTKMSA